jgi:EmrB/QacA subfamily drug resistance transporter
MTPVTVVRMAGVQVEKRASQGAIFLVLAVAVSAYALLQSLVVPVLSTIQASLHTSQNTVTWVLTAYLLSASVFTPIAGRLGDMWGKDRILVLCLGALAVGSLLAAVATSIGVMIVARVIQGIGGGVLPLAFGIIRDEYEPERVAGAVGTVAGLTAAGSGIGLVLAGPIVHALNYHWLFWIPMGVNVAAMIAAHFVVPPSPTRSPGRLNWLAIALLSSWLVALLVPVSEAPTWGWVSTKVLGLIALSAVLFVAWIWVEAHSDQPLIDMKMMRLPIVWTTNVVAFLFGAGLYATMAFIPEFVQTPSSTGYGFGASITHSGLLVLPMGAVMFVFSLMSGRLTARFGGKALLVAGSMASVGTFVMLTFAHDYQWEILLALAIQGVGFGLAFAAMSSLVVEGVPASQTGVASGMNANIRTIGGSIGVAIASTIITSGVHAGSFPKASGYTHGFGFLTVTTIAAALASLLVPSVRRHLTSEEFQSAQPHAELGMVAAGTLIGSDPE